MQERLTVGAEVFLAAVTLGELYYGAAKSGRAQQNMARIDEFASGRTTLPCDVATAREYGRLKAQLRAKGRPLPENDLWIAATARLHGLALVTRDSHFHAVEDLAVEIW